MAARWAPSSAAETGDHERAVSTSRVPRRCTATLCVRSSAFDPANRHSPTWHFSRAPWEAPPVTVQLETCEPFTRKQPLEEFESVERAALLPRCSAVVSSRPHHGEPSVCGLNVGSEMDEQGVKDGAGHWLVLDLQRGALDGNDLGTRREARGPAERIA